MTIGPYDDPPPNLRSLMSRLENVAGSSMASNVLKVTVAGVVVGQLLPDGAVKGGAAIKIRLGDRTSRFTQDLHFARREDQLETFLDEFVGNLEHGWHGFTGRLVTKAPPRPSRIPAAYVMRPYEVKLSYRARAWLTLPFELGHDEIGDTDCPDMALAAELLEIFLTLGLPAPDPIPVLALDHQIAQKLHACSTVNNERAHDLVDLQLLRGQVDVDLGQVGTTCRRLFASRRAQPWPPTVVAYDGWTDLYADAAVDLTVLADVTDAVDWVNNLIREIDIAPSQPPPR